MTVLATLNAALSDRYEVERELGHGGMAQVYVARDLRFDRRVAIKVLRPDLTPAVGSDRFLREIEVVARLQHPHILSLFDSGVADGLLYYVMPLVEGETLRSRLRREGQLPIADVLRIAAQVASGLDHAHGHGVIHRDIKPENILLSGDDAYVADFGIARLAEAAGGEWQSPTGTATWRTESGIVVGTLGYMSPEQATGAPCLDGRSDQYGLGCVVFEMLAGETPFQGNTLQILVPKLLTLPPPSVRVVRDTVPAGMDAALRRALSRIAADRFRTCADFVAALGQRSGWRERALDLASTRRGKGALTLSALSAAAIIIGIVAWGRRGDDALGTDSTRYVIFPFEREEGAAASLSEGRLQEAFRRWADITVVPSRQVREALGRDSTPSTEAQAEAISRALGARWYVRASVAPVDDSLWLYATLYDVRTRGPPLAEHGVRIARDLTGADEALGHVADQLLFQGAPPPDGTPGPRTTHSRAAADALARGQRAQQAWNLTEADSAYSAAARADDAYAQAYLGLALVRAWTGAEPATWRVAAEQADLRRERLSDREQGLVDAIVAQANGDMERACPLWQRLARADRQSYTAWYGYAFCLRSDSSVVRHRSSPSGWRFRSSYEEAVRAYRRAFELNPAILSAFRVNSYGTARALLMTSARRMRDGRSADGRLFQARPILTGDSLLLLPYPIEAARNPVAPWDPASVQAAVDRQRKLFRDVAVQWVTQFPKSAAAMEALAVSLEMLGSPAAIDTFRHARALAATIGERTSAAAGEIWMEVKLGAGSDPTRLRRAKALADSVLHGEWVAGPELRLVAGLAALTGRAGTAASILQRNATISGWPPPALQSAPVLLIFASLGGPADTLRALEQQVARQLERVPAPSRADLAMEWLAGPARLAGPTVILRSIEELRAKGDYLVDAFAAWAARDTLAVRRMLADLRAAREAVPPHERAIDAVYPEAVLFTRLGDHRGAAAWLDPTLNSLPLAAPGTFNYPARPGALIMAMALRAELAARTGEAAEGRRWAQAVAILCADADEFLHGLVERMRDLAT